MLSVFCGIMLALMLRFPLVVLHSARNGFDAFTNSILPTLFPYMVFCQLTGDMLTRKTSLPSMIPCAVLGLLGGSPNGARICAAMYTQGHLTRRQLHTLCALCGTISPIFILGTLENWAKQQHFGACVLLAHWLGALICGLITYIWTNDKKMYRDEQSEQRSSAAPLRLTDAIIQSAQAMLGIGGCIMLFSVLAAMPAAIFPNISPVIRAVLHGLLEMAGGSQALIQLPLSSSLRCSAVSACISWGGIFIMMQNLLFLRPVGIRLLQLILIRFAHAVLSGFIAFFIILLF